MTCSWKTIKINNLSVVECKLIKQLNKEDHVVCFKSPCVCCLFGGRGGGGYRLWYLIENGVVPWGFVEK